MNSLDWIFSQYDKLIGSLPIATQALISFALLIFLLFKLFMFIKSGHWLILAAIVLFLPMTWPATHQIALLGYNLLKFLLVRTELLFIHI